MAQSPESEDTPSRSLSDKLFDKVVQRINDVDRKAVSKRVDRVKKKYPQADVEQWCETLIKHKCRKAGAVGALSAGPASIPGIGTVAALTIGTSADLMITATLQAELVLEIAQAHDLKLAMNQERNAILLITGFQAGTSKLAGEVGKRVASKASKHLAEKSLARALPVLGMAASAGINHVTTYLVGQRAMAYCRLGPEQMEDSSETLRTISGIDERKLTEWLSETGEKTRALIGSGMREAGGKVITLSKDGGNLLLTGATQGGSLIYRAASSVGSGLFWLIRLPWQPLKRLLRGKNKNPPDSEV